MSHADWLVGASELGLAISFRQMTLRIFCAHAEEELKIFRGSSYE
jgi:hypothetical protein